MSSTSRSLWFGAILVLVLLMCFGKSSFVDPHGRMEWLRITHSDELDDSELGCTLYYEIDADHKIVISRTDRGDRCPTNMTIVFLGYDIPDVQWIKRAAAMLEDDYERKRFEVTFLFKKGDKEVKLTKIPFAEREEENLELQFPPLKSIDEKQTKGHSKQKKLFAKFQDADEVRIQTRAYGKEFNMKLKADTFAKKWDWLTDLSFDKHTDKKGRSSGSEQVAIQSDVYE